MYVDRLAKWITSGEKKGQQALVSVKNSKLDEKNPKDIEIDQDRFEFPQFGPKLPVGEDGKPARQLSDEEARQAIEEFIANSGSVQRAVEVVNDATRTAAVNAGKARIRNASTGEVDAIVDAGLKVSREFSWAEERKVTASEAKDIVTQLVAANIEEKSPEELKAMLLALLPK